MSPAGRWPALALFVSDQAHMSSTRLNYELTVNTARSQILTMYKGTLVGFGWAVLSPLVMLGIYTTVFTQIFAARWPGFEAPEFFAFNLFIGLILHGWLAECLQRGPGLVVASAGLLKRIQFPVPVLSYSLVAASSLQVLISLVILCVLLAVSGNPPHLATLLVPLLLIPFAVMLVALGLALSSLGVYFRDLSMLTGFLATGLLFLSPIFYPAERVPEVIQPWLFLNPLTLPIESARGLIFHGTLPNPVDWLIYSSACLAGLIASRVVFAKLKNGFADVL